MDMSIQPMATKKLRAVPAGDILRNDFLEPLGITSYRSAKELGVTADRRSVPRAAA
jgi:plasmid maintenance system antidote protein VapI